MFVTELLSLTHYVKVVLVPYLRSAYDILKVEIDFHQSIYKWHIRDCKMFEIDEPFKF